MSKASIAITGSTGFIGGAVLREALQEQDRQVIVLVRADSRRDRLPAGDYKVIEYESLASDVVIRELRAAGTQVFIHCAWRGVGGGDRNESFQISENVPFTIQTVTTAAAAGCSQWIGLGSQAEYGNLNARLDEGAALTPTTIYGKGKLAAGISALGLCEAHGILGSWLRVFSTYGPGDAPTWFTPYLIQEFLAERAPKLTACEQLWDYLYVADAARAVLATADARAQGVFNLGSGTAHCLKDYIEKIRSVLGTKVQPEYGAVPYRLDQVMHLEADISKLTARTGWRPIISLDDGLRATIDFEHARSCT